MFGGLVPFFVGEGDRQQRIVDFLSIDINKYRTAHTEAVAMRENLPRYRESIDGYTRTSKHRCASHNLRRTRDQAVAHI